MAENSTTEALKLRIKQLERRLGEAEEKKAAVTVSDMNQMFGSHLSTLKFILLTVSFFVSAGFAALTWVGYNNVKDMVGGKVTQAVEEIKKDTIIPLEKKYREIVERQDQQDKKIDIELYINSAERDYENKRYGRALTSLNKAIELGANGLNSYGTRGLVYYELNRYADAVADFDRVIEIDPNEPVIYSAKVAALVKLKRYPEALKVLDKIDPSYIDHYDKACVFAATNKPIEKTLQNLKKSIERDKNLKKEAQKEDCFKSIRNNPKFRKIVGLE